MPKQRISTVAVSFTPVGPARPPSAAIPTPPQGIYIFRAQVIVPGKPPVSGGDESALDRGGQALAAPVVLYRRRPGVDRVGETRRRPREGKGDD